LFADKELINCFVALQEIGSIFKLQRKDGLRTFLLRREKTTMLRVDGCARLADCNLIFLRTD
jgi:hypothetical protein